MTRNAFFHEYREMFLVGRPPGDTVFAFPGCAQSSYAAVHCKAYEAIYIYGGYQAWKHSHDDNCTLWRDWGKCLEITGITLKNVPFDGLTLDEARTLKIL